MSAFPGRVGLQQRILPAYRAPFFDALAAACEGGLSLFAGEARPREAVKSTHRLQVARYAPAGNLHLLGGPLYLCWQRGLLAWLDAWEPDALIVEANPRYLSTPRAVRWMKSRGRPVVGWGLGAPPLQGPFAPVRRSMRLNLLRSLDALVAYSRRGAAEYRALGFPQERIFVASNAVSPRPGKPPPERAPTLEGHPTVLFVGRLQARKRLDVLFSACAALPESLQPHLLVVGDGPARPEFETLAQSLYPQAQFPGALHGPELEPLFARADLFVLPGTGGLAIQQAMTHALPVIVAEGDGTQEDLVRPANGWLVPPGNLPALTRALHTALSDVPRLRRMGAESFRITAEEINLEAMVSVFIEVLNGVV